MDYPSVLESYLIPAEEGFISSDQKYFQLEKLTMKAPLFIFTQNPDIQYGGIDIKKYLRKYGFSRSIHVNYEMYIKMRLSGAKITGIDPTIQSILTSEKLTPTQTTLEYTEYLNKVFVKLINYSKQTNTLVVFTTSNTQMFSLAAMRNVGIIVNDMALLKMIFYKAIGAPTNSIQTFNAITKDFKRFENDLKNIKIIKPKDLGYDLYHISPDSTITQLTPRYTVKPMRSENIGIPRISSAPSVDACCRALIGGTELKPGDKKIYYVYKLDLSNNQRLAIPPSSMVPDQKYTNEVWILDPCPVKPLGYLIIEHNKTTGELIFNTNNLPSNITIYTYFTLNSKNKIQH